MMPLPSEFKRSLIVFAAFSALIVFYRKINLFKIFKSKKTKKSSDSIDNEQSTENNLELVEEPIFESVKMPSMFQQQFVKILTKKNLQNCSTQDEISLFMKKIDSDALLKNSSIQEITENCTNFIAPNNSDHSEELTNGSNHIENPDYVHINTPNDAYALTNGEVCTKSVDISIKSHNSNLICNNLSPKSADESVEPNDLNGEHKENTSPTALPEIPVPDEKKTTEICNDVIESTENSFPCPETVNNVNCDVHSLDIVQGGSLVTKTDAEPATQFSGMQVSEENSISDLAHSVSQFQIEEKPTEIIVPNVFVQESNSVSPDPEELLFYEFYLDQDYVGRLIGRGGSFINRVKQETKTYILIQEKYIVSKSKLCVIRGTRIAINEALKLISKRFRYSRFKDFRLTLLDKYPQCPPFDPNLALGLVIGSNNPVIVSCVVNPGHMFFQMLTHPLFQSFADLQMAINAHYSTESLSIGTPVEGMLCVAFFGTSWHRCVIINVIDVYSCQIKLLDIGGYLVISNVYLRQIHQQHLDLPFQAVEGYLNNIKPPNNATEWPIEAYQMVTSYLHMSRSIIVHIVNYSLDSTSLVNIYIQIDRKIYVFLNAMLVEQGLAEWANPPVMYNY